MQNTKKQISKTKIKGQLRKKTNSELKATITLALKQPAWHKIAALLSTSTRRHKAVNLFEIDNQTALGDTVIIPGKVLSKGNLTKKIKICALSISSLAKEKLKATKSEFATIGEEIKKNPKAEGIKIIQ